MAAAEDTACLSHQMQGEYIFKVLSLNMPHLYLISSSQEDSSSCYSKNPAEFNWKHIYSYILLSGEICTSLSPTFSFTATAMFLIIVEGVEKHHHIG